jgi:hypothetical protein
MQTPAVTPHLPWVQERVDGLLYELRALAAELRALARAPAPGGAAPAAAEGILAQAALLAQECALLRDALARLPATGRLEEAGEGLLDPAPRPS